VSHVIAATAVAPGGPAIVMALVLAELSVGGLIVLWVTPLWGEVRWGFFKLAGTVIAVCAVLAWLASRAPLLDQPHPRIVAVAVTVLAAFAGLTVLWQILLWARARAAARIVAFAAMPVGVAALVGIALDPATHAHAAVSVLQLLAGALFLGAATDGLLLGHWHLVDRTLARAHLGRINVVFLAGCALAAAAALAGGTGGGRARADLSPLLGVGVLTVSIAVGLTALCALIGGFIRALVRENSLQSATGLFYLGVIMALAAEFAAKVRFF
jgi:hypothetical protein